jgi:hypothetical protein
MLLLHVRLTDKTIVSEFRNVVHSVIASLKRRGEAIVRQATTRLKVCGGLKTCHIAQLPPRRALYDRISTEYTVHSS